MATHSHILVWRTPWAEEPGGLQFIEPQRVKHAWSDWAHVVEYHLLFKKWILDFPGGPVVKILPASAGDMGLILDPENATRHLAAKPMLCNTYQACAP